MAEAKIDVRAFNVHTMPAFATETVCCSITCGYERSLIFKKVSIVSWLLRVVQLLLSLTFYQIHLGYLNEKKKNKTKKNILKHSLILF